MATIDEVRDLERAAWTDRDAVVESLRGAPWSSYELSDERAQVLSESVAVVTYRAVARRGTDEYAALFNSTYMAADGTWRLALHQQTPI